jgi:hypothetical protein
MKQVLVQETKRQVPELVQQVIDILRTTKVQQCFGSFADMNGRFCAFGAIRHSFGLYNDMGWTIENPDVYDHVRFMENTIDTGLIMNGKSSVVILNDVYHMSFSEIADRIEDVFTK